jgi:hypothetical protein
MKKKAVLIDPWPASRTYLATVLSRTFQVHAASSIERAKHLVDSEDEIALVVVTKSAAMATDVDQLGERIRSLADVAKTVVIGCDLTPQQIADLAGRDIEAIPRGSELWFFSGRALPASEGSDDELVDVIGRLLLPALARCGVEISGPGAGEALLLAAARLIAKEVAWASFKRKFAKAARVRLSQLAVSALLAGAAALLARLIPGLKVPW